MTTQPEKNISPIESSKDLPNTKRFKTERPNIDHLIKRIRVERRSEKRKDLLTFGTILFLVGGISLYSLFN